MNYRTLVILINIWHVIHITEQQTVDLPPSPCPNLFQYKFDIDQWVGIIEVPSPPIDQNRLILHVTLSLRAATSQNNIGSISIAGTPQEATNNIINQQPLQFRVRFPYVYPIPKLVKIIYNDNLLCIGPEEAPSDYDVITRIDLRHVLSTFTNSLPSSANNVMQPNQQNNVNIGSDHFNQILSTNNNAIYNNSNQFSPSIANSQSFTVPNKLPPKPILSPVMSVFIPSEYADVTTISTTELPVIQQTTAAPSSSSHTDNNTINKICGTRYSETEVTPLVFGGEETKRGEWPWMVAIYLNKPSGLSFNCGGSLVSSKSVITAAHCINTSKKKYKPEEVLLWLGRYSLVDWSEVDAFSSTVEQIIIHKDYKRQKESYDADIAILIMTKHVEFNEFIRPVCLWPEGFSIREVEGKKGTVVGWGKDENDKIVSNIPKKIDLPIVNPITCVQTSEPLYKAVSNRTFCAGTLDGDGPCHGDSGGSLTLYQNDRWMLRGIISAGLSDANTGACKLMDYVIFTDVSRFTLWIQRHMQL